MCRSIKTLRRPGETATTGELEAAARQYVRKLSGYREPSARNQEAFEAAVAEIAHASRHLVEVDRRTRRGGSEPLDPWERTGPNATARSGVTSPAEATSPATSAPWWVRPGLDIDEDGRLRIAGADPENAGP